MNERIELGNKTILWFIRNSRTRQCVTWASDGLNIDGNNFDLEGLRAMRDIFNCRLDADSFDALSDTSVVLFHGKEVRFLHNPDPATAIHRWPDGSWQVAEKLRTYFVPKPVIDSNTCILPLTPPTPPTPQEPRYMAFVFISAAAFFARHGEFTLTSAGGEVRTVCSVGLTGFYTNMDTWIPFSEAPDWKLADGTPCGVRPADEAT